MLFTYGRIYEHDYGKMSREKLIEATKCLMPCTYMEYEVLILNNMLINIYKKMVGIILLEGTIFTDER